MTVPSLPISGTIVVSTSETWPADLIYTFAPGAKIQVMSGAVLTIRGRVEAGRAKIFETIGAGSKVAGVSEVMPEWWGATGDGLNDDAPAIQAAVDCISAAEKSASAGGRARVALQSYGRYRCDSTIELKPSPGVALSIVGAGTVLDGSRLIAGSTSMTGPLLKISPVTLPGIGSVIDVELANFALVRGASTMETGLLIGGQGDPQAYCRVANLMIDDFKIGLNLTKTRLWHISDCLVSSSEEAGARACLIEDGGGRCGDLQFTNTILQVKGVSTPAGSSTVRIQNTTAGTELKGVRFSDCVFYGGAVGLDLYSTRELGDIYVSTGCQFDYEAPGTRVLATADESGVIDNIQITGVDFRGANAQIIPVRFERAQITAVVRDISITECRFTGFERAVHLYGVTGAVVSNNRLYAIGGFFAGTNIDWAIAFSDSTCFSAIGNIGHNPSNYVLQHGVMVVGASDDFTVIGNAFSGLTTSAAVVNGASGVRKQVALNTP